MDPNGLPKIKWAHKVMEILLVSQNKIPITLWTVINYCPLQICTSLYGEIWNGHFSKSIFSWRTWIDLKLKAWFLSKVMYKIILIVFHEWKKKLKIWASWEKKSICTIKHFLNCLVSRQLFNFSDFLVKPKEFYSCFVPCKHWKSYKIINVYLTFW